MEDEIALGDVLGRIWARRGVVFSMLLVGLLGSVAVTSLRLGSAPYAEVLYYVDLKGIEKGHYPGGTAFSPNDLQSREVLGAVAEALELNGDPAAVERIAAALLIEHGSPATRGIVQKYQHRLTSPTLAVAEIDAINDEFRDELAMASGGSLRLMLNTSAAGLTPEVARRVVQEIPAQWSRVYSERYRIYQDPGLERFAVSLETGPLDRPATVIAARAALKTMRTGLRSMARDNRVNHLVNSSGSSSSEVLDRLLQFENIQFRPLSESVMTQRDPVADSYRYELRRRIQLLQVKRASYDRIAEDVGGFESKDLTRGEAEAGSQVNQFQLSGDALHQIIGLAEQASSATFLRDVMLKRHAVVSEIAEIEAELAHLDTPSSFAPPPGFAAAVEAQLTVLLKEYNELYAVSREDLRSNLGTLYSAASAPFAAAGEKPQRAVLTVAGVMVGALLLGALTALAVPGSSEKKLVRV